MSLSVVTPLVNGKQESVATTTYNRTKEKLGLSADSITFLSQSRPRLQLGNMTKFQAHLQMG
jgi:hypothetical protein